MNNQEYLNSIKPGAIEGWHKYKIAPSITGAQAVIESGWGSSKLAKPPYNNNFGIKAGDDWTGRKITMSTREYINGKWITINDDFRAYDTLSDSIADHGAFFTNTEWRKDNYREVVGQIDYKKAAISLRKAGYATDPSYSQKLINIIEQNDLQSWDQEALKGETTKIDTPQTIPVSTDANITASGGKKKIVGGSISSDARNGISQFTLSVIGDSLGVGTEPFLKQYPWARQSYDNYGSRQWTHETDVYNGITALNNMKNAGNLNNNVVFILGTNRGVDASEIDEAVSICGRDRNLILVDTTSEVNHRTKVSSEYEKAASRHDNVFYANWSSYSRANIGAWYYADGANGTRIHMNPTGYQKHADFIVQAVYEANQIIFETSVKVDPIKPSTETVNIYDIEYDDGVFTSPKGDSSIYNKALNDQLGFRARKGRIMWIERKYSGSETDSASLLNAALEKMKEASVPAAQYTVNMRYLPDNISIGDTGVFIDHEFDPPLYIQARVLAMTTSESNPANNTVTIGNVVEVTPQPKSDLLSIQKELQDTREMSLAEYWKVKPVTLQVTTSNGLVLKPKNNETFAQLVTKYNQEHVLKNGSLLVDMRNAKDKNATITITGSIKNNYIDSVDEIVNNINYDDYNNVNFDDGPIDVNSNPQGQDVVDINDYNNIRKLIVDSFDVEFLNVDGNVVGSEKVYVYEDSTFVSKIINPGQHINKIRILSPRDCTFDNISAIDESIKLTDTAESTSVYVKVFQEEKEVTHEFKNFKWTRVSQNTRLDNEWNDVNKWNESNNIDLDVKDVFGSESTFICRVYDDEYNFVSATSITLAVSTNGKSAYDVWIEAGNEGSEEDYLSSLKGEDGKDGMSEEEAQTIKQQVEEAITGAEQAKEKAQSAYTNAVADAKAEAERLDNERQLIIDGKFEVVNKANETLEQSIATAEQNAQDALTKAGASVDLASTAKQASDNALSQFQTTSTELAEAKATAEETLQNAINALSGANSVITQSQTLLDNATQAKTEATNALISANSAIIQSQTLLDNAESAKTEATNALLEAQKQLEASGVISGNLTTFKNEVNNTIKGYVTKSTYDSNNQTLNTRMNEWEKTADGIKTSISEVEGKIPTEIGTRNLILNSDTREWFPYQGSTLTHTKDITVEDWNTNNAINVKGTGGDNRISAILGTGRGDMDAYIESDKPYTYSIYVRNNGTNILSINTNGNVGGYALEPNESRRIVLSGKRTLLPGQQSVNQFTVSTEVGESFDFDYWHPQIERGLIVSDWKLAIEDTVTQSEYSVYKNETEETVKGFTRTVSAYEQDVTGYKNQVATFSQTVDGYKSEVAKQTQTVNGLTTEVANYKQAVDGYSVELSKNTTATNGYKTEVAGYKQTVSGYSSKLAEYTQSNNTLTSKVNSYEATVDGYSQSLTRVEGKIDGGIGGRNLILGSDTRELYPYQGSNLTHTRGIEVPEWNATDAIKVTGTTGSHTVFATLSTGRPSKTDPDSYVISGEPYTYSIYFKNDGVNDITVNSNGNVGGDVVKSGELKRVILSDYVPETGSKSFNQFTISAAIGSKVNFTYWHPQIEKGLIVSDWKLALEEQVRNTEFKSYQNQVKSTTDEHSRRLTALDGTGGRVSKVEQTATQIQTSLSDYAKTAYVNTQITNKAGEINTNLSTLRGDFDNLQIGGRNLLSNTESFNPLPPLITNNPENEYIFQYSTGRLKVGDVNGTVLIKFAINELIKQGDVFTVSFMGQSWNSKTSRVRFKVPWGAWSETKRIGDAGVPTYNTFLVEAPVREIPDYIETNHFWMEVEYPFYFRPKSLKIEKGNKPTDWTPAPEDMVTQTEFQTVKETTSLYERTIGTTETGIKSNIAKITMTDSLFQTEVGKYSDKPRNLLYDPINLSRYNRIGSHNLIELNNATGKLLRVTVTDVSSTTDTYNGAEFPLSTTSLPKGDYSFRIAVWVDTIPERGFTIRLFEKGGSNWYFKTHKPTTTGYQTFTGNFTLSQNVSNFDPMCFQIYLRGNGQIAIGHGVLVNSSVVPTEIYDSGDNFLTSQVTQLSNSWALTLKSGNDIKTAINATTNGIRLKGNLITLDGQVNMTSSFIVPEGNIGNLSAKKITSGTIDSARIDAKTIVTNGLQANVITSTHILADNALFDKLFTNDLATQKLATKQAWIKSGMIANAQIGTAQIDKIDASNGKIVNLDVNYLTGNKAELISAGFQSLNSNLSINGGAIRIVNSDGDFATMNAIPEVRSQDSAGTAAILGKGRSQYYSNNQSRFYIGSSLNGDEYNGSVVHGVHISIGQTWGIYRKSDSFGGTPARYHIVKSGESWRSITNKYLGTNASVGILMQLNGYNVNNYPVLQPGDTILIKKEVPGNSSGIERIWTMGTSSNGATRTYSHVHHVFEGGTTGVSDARLKHDIKPTDIKALDHIADLSFKQFKWNRNDALEPLGLIAQESGILRVPDEEMEGIDIQRAMMLALKGIQELSQKVQELEEQNETLRTNNRGTSY